MQAPSKFNRGRLKYTTGDATTPQAGGFKYIIQVNNDEGSYSRGFAMALARKWPSVQAQYRAWYLRNHGSLELGAIDSIHVQSDTVVINMIAQHGTEPDEDGNPPIRYEALRECLKKVAEKALIDRGTIHAPRIGCGLAGGDWKEVEKIIDEELIGRGLNVTVYDLPEND